MRVDWPDGRRFAFSLLDDTDDSTLENVRPVYDRLRHHGLRTTKTVWPLDCPEGSRHYFAADTLQRREYLDFVKELVADGFELASHGATMETSERERTLRALEFLEREFGFVPRLHANHGSNRENLYWGAKRFQTPALRRALRLVRRSAADPYAGEIPGSPWFWGDACREHFQYVRNFTFRSLNLLSVNPEMPYRLESTPFVNHWFSTTDASSGEHLKRRFTRKRLDRLEREGGVCIVSTHLGKKYLRDGRLDPEIDAIFRDLASRSGWYAPVSEILDHLGARVPGAGQTLGARTLLRLETRYLLDQAVSRLTGPDVTYP